METLNSKIEAFCRGLALDGLNQTQAYEAAYPDRSGTEKTARENACKLAAQPRVKDRIAELRNIVAENSAWKRMDSINTLAKIARDSEAKNADRVNAVKALNTMHGWEKQVIDHTSGGKTIKTFGQLYGVPES